MRPARTGVKIAAAALTLAAATSGSSMATASGWTSAPVPASPLILQHVSADSSTDVWAVGGPFGGNDSVVHYDGSGWKVAVSPQANGTAFILTGVAAVSPTNVWVAGDDQSLGLARIAHWDGAVWTLSPVRK